MRTIQLTEKEFILLNKVLEEAKDTRSDMSCNDAYSDEEKLFTKEERFAMSEFIVGKKETEERNGNMNNSSYVDYLIKRMKGQYE